MTSKKILPTYIKKFADPKDSAIDFGCGNGKAFNLIAPHFKTLLGLDISQKLLDQAAKLSYQNVSLQQADTYSIYSIAQS
ncbi:MAG: methyltransferase domain-containing protein [Cyclobacteriaceae bacterium]